MCCLFFLSGNLLKMAAPVVTRPSATHVEDSPKSAFDSNEVAHWAKWLVIGCAVLAGIGLVAFAVVTLNQRQQTQTARAHWDEVYKAMKDKTRPQDIIVALEGVSEKVKGTPVHAFVLMKLGDTHFEIGTNVTKSPEERRAALDKAIQLYTLVGTTVPYNANPIFAPLAIESATLAMEQIRDYDGAIKLLEENLPKLDSTLKAQGSHNMLSPKMQAQLGRLYWMRAQTGTDAAKKKEDREKAREKLTDVVLNRPDKDAEEKSAWREQAEYLKSLIDAHGKALPEGAPVPPVKPPPAAAVPTPAVPLTGTAAPAPVVTPAAPVTPAPATPAVTPPATPEKKDAPKELPKEDKKSEGEKKTHLREGGASQHFSMSQIQKMVKEGKTAFCECPRCDDTTNASAGARLVE